MSDLQNLYQELILDHSRTPHGYGLRDEIPAQSHQLNPTCGDEITLQVHRDADGSVEAIAWEGHGLRDLAGIGVSAGGARGRTQRRRPRGAHRGLPRGDAIPRHDRTG